MKVYLSHSKKMDYINELYNPIKEAFFLNRYDFYFPHEKSSKSFNGFDYYKQFGVIIAEVSQTGTGIGIELGFAYSLNIPIICFYKKGTKYANSLKSVTDKFFEYDSIEDFLFKLYIALENRHAEYLTITYVYNMLGIPEHLQKHMLDTAAICYLIASNIRTSEETIIESVNVFGVRFSIDKVSNLEYDKPLVKEMLFHDVGSLLKLQPHEIKSDLTRWIRDYLDKKFNGNDHLATNFICKLFDFTDEQIERLNSKILANCINVANSDDICIKVEAYADQRVSPNGLVSLKERFEELDADVLLESALAIEEQIFKVCRLKKEDINKDSVEEISNKLKYFFLK